MKWNRRGICLLAVSLAFALTGCGQTAQTEEKTSVEGLDKLGAIEVVAREDGSGTRSAFAELVGFAGDGTDESQSDRTTRDAFVANNAEEVIAEVEKNGSAIGYVSQGALTGSEGVKVLTTEGNALNRSFYLAYVGNLNDLQQDFLTYVHSAGQEIVGASYTSVAKSNTFLSNQAEGTLTINGSTSVAPLMKDLAAAYEKINTNARIEVTESDSTQGLTQAMSGSCDFGMSSRDLKNYEMELLDYEAIATDNIAVIAGADNPLESISLDALKDIYTGEIKNWDDLNK